MSPAKPLAPPLLVGALTVACFFPSLGNGFVNFDDQLVFLDNPHIRGLSLPHLRWMFTTFYVGIYQPLTWVMYAVDYSVWGLDPRGYHLTALLFHSANAVLVYLLIRQILRCASGPKATADTSEAWAAAAGALFFSLHPLRVEPVAWASARGQIQAAVFSLLTLLTYLRAQRAGDPPRRRRWLAVSVGCFLVCMLTKTLAIMLPAVLLVIDHFALRRFRTQTWSALIAEKLPYFAISAVFLMLAVLAKALTGSLAVAGGDAHGIPERLLQSGYGLVFYLVKTAAPIELSPLYPLERQLVLREPIFYVTALASVAVTIAFLALYRRWPALLGAWLAYAILVFPVLGLTQSGPQITADRYTYHSCVAWAVLLAVGLQRLAARSSAPGRRVLAAAVAVVLASLGVLAAYQTRIWRDPLALWGHAIALHPESGLIRYFWANTLREQGNLDEAIAEYSRALELGVRRAADTYNARAAAYREKGERDRAIADVTQAIRLVPRAGFYLNRGLIRADADLRGALADWEEALRLAPDFARAYHNRGIAREALGDPVGAIADYEKALTLSGMSEAEREDAKRRLAALRPRRS